MDEMDGFEVLAALEGEDEPQVIVVSMFADRSTVAHALKAGAAGYVSKHAGTTEILAAVRAVSAGELYLCTRTRPLLEA
jgi:DNA-binding NarL/FixJ family response regulator